MRQSIVAEQKLNSIASRQSGVAAMLIAVSSLCLGSLSGCGGTGDDIGIDDVADMDLESETLGISDPCSRAQYGQEIVTFQSGAYGLIEITYHCTIVGTDDAGHAIFGWVAGHAPPPPVASVPSYWL